MRYTDQNPEADQLVKEIERIFGVNLDREPLRGKSTVEDLYRMLRAQAHRGSSRGCMTATVFWRLRRAFSESLGTAKRDFRRWTEMPFLLPSQERRAKWKQIERLSGLKMPELEFHPALLLLFFIPGMLLLLLGSPALGLALSVLLPIWMGPALLSRPNPLLNRLPRGACTLEEMTRAIVTLNYGQLLSEGYYSDQDLRASFYWFLRGRTDVAVQPTETLEELSELVL